MLPSNHLQVFLPRKIEKWEKAFVFKSSLGCYIYVINHSSENLNFNCVKVKRFYNVTDKTLYKLIIKNIYKS